ncbi:aldo/keto reductase [Streptomyces litchfieldiae]|uniref:Aldo/keto reductase n=1 Tax=Streptomyces litchfieldiae TaxID=3075543 RepID=A0ABU2MVD9_9ACTN|nr:aldo/keto reductase [Streptomyces sp. DSM 44938]MDT0345603.1 aldo/keto reductase [Streptomyces sp. DSM 44938]
MAFSRFTPEATPAARVGLGLAAVGRPGYINLGRDRDLPGDRTPEALRERSHRLLDAAHAAGVRYLDAARSYGMAESFLADWLAARPGITDVVVGSKWGYTYTAGWRADAETHEVKDHGAATFDRQYAETRALLGDRLDLYQIHSVTPDSPALNDPAVLDRLARLAEDGVSVGLSTSGPGQADAIRAALAVTVDGRPLFTTVQSTFNVLEQSAGPALAEAHAAGLTVIVKEAVANGRLARRDTAPPELAALAQEYGVGCDTVALAAVLNQPWAGLVLSGAATLGQLRSNVAAARLHADPERLAALARLAEPPADYWRTRSALPWT